MAAPLKEPLIENGTTASGPSPVWYLLWALSGLFEGFAFRKACIVYPAVLADQFVFRNFAVLKFFIAAVGSSMVSQGLMSTVMPTVFSKSMDYGANSYGNARVAIGCAILGVGMAIAGSGPSMFVPSLACHVTTATYLLAGGLVAALAVAIVDTFAPATGAGAPADRQTLPKLLGKAGPGGYAAVALPMGLVMLAAAVGLESVVNYQEDMARYGGALAEPYPDALLDYPAWPPIIGGMALGLAQVPVRVVSGDGLGTATSFSILISTLSLNTLSPGKSLLSSKKNWWQPAFVLLVFVGAFFCDTLGPSLKGATSEGVPVEEGFPPMQMALGAFLAIAGARVAGGCTCGHGVSGTAELSLESFVGAAAIFGGAIATKCIMVFT